MREIIISWAICSLVLLTALFFGFAFAEWNVNAGEWNSTSRGSLAALSLVLELLITLLALSAASKLDAE